MQIVSIERFSQMPLQPGADRSIDGRWKAVAHTRIVRRPLGALVIGLTVAVIAGCAVTAPATTAANTPATSSTPLVPTTEPTSIAAAAPVALSLLLEPDQGMNPIYALLTSAHRSVDLTMYELEDTHAEQLLAADAARGVDVRVILDHAYIGTANNAAYSYLLARGVHVRWASSLYDLTHQKTLTVDSAVSVIMSLNWTSRYYSDTRDVAVIDRTAADVAAVVATFNADFDGSRITPGSGADLVWSPTTSQPDLLQLINGAHHLLLVENEEMDSEIITDALIAAAHRGVEVEVCMTNSSSWSAAFAQLIAAGVHLRVYSPSAALYIHAKVLVSDPGTSVQVAFAGSQNFSTASLRYNRELGVLVRAPALVSELNTMVQQDFNGATPWG
jgi:cardiolipin synthase A/B